MSKLNNSKKISKYKYTNIVITHPIIISINNGIFYINGYSCAACESFIGDLKEEKNEKYLNWKKMPIREREKEKDSNFKKFGLDLVIVNKKSNNDYTIIPINDNDNSNSDEDPDDMDNLRGTISYNKSKTGDIKESKKRVNIFDVLRKSCK